MAASAAALALLLQAAACDRPPKEPERPAVAAEGGGPAPALVRTLEEHQSKPKCFEIVPEQADLGILESNERREVVFEVFNRSSEPFSITSVRGSCKCLALQFDREPIAPGKSGRVHSTVTAINEGVRKTEATVYLSDPDHSSQKIEFHYGIVPEVMVKPRRIDFGRVDAGVASVQTATITLHLPDGITEPVLEPFLQDALPIRIELDPPKITEVGRGMHDLSTTMRLTLQSDQPLKPFETMLVFQSKTERTYRMTTVPVTGQVADAWRFERPSLAFGIVDVGAEVTKTIKFFWSGDAPPAVLELKADVPELAVSHTVDAEKQCFLVSVKCAPAKPGRIEGEVRLTTRQGEPPATLKVTARAK